MSKTSSRTRKIALYASLGFAAAASTCSPRPGALQRVFATEHLRVAMVESPTTCYNAANGPSGFECDLLNGLAKRFGVALELHFVDSAQAALEQVSSGRADLAAGGIAADPAPKLPVRFASPLQSVALQLVYRAGSPAPAALETLKGELRVVAGSSAAALLEREEGQHPNLAWTTADDLSEEELLDAVADGEVQYTIAPSTLVALEQRYYPSLRVALDVTPLQPVAWAVRSGAGPALYGAVQDYLARLGETELARLRDRYFGHMMAFDYQGVARFAADVQRLLPRYRPQFDKAAKKYGLDWRMLAAIGYQESHWDPSAVSGTGVRGLMMLTEDTAAQLEIADREDPAQSIFGGARYLALILKLLPAEIAEPDRTWMALAAYNQGLAHLDDARTLADARGGDSKRWLDVKNALPLLSRPQYFKQTRSGYARGREAVNFVGNVRNYYDILNWLVANGGPSAIPQKSSVDEAVRVGDFRSADARPARPGAGASR